jgi:tetratricopeptide (TPR) repeat protein
MTNFNTWKMASAVILLCAGAVCASPAQTFKTLANLGGTTGAYPGGSLVQGVNGNFYGAIALNPNFAGAHDAFGVALAYQGQLDEAVIEGKRAAELDPLSPQIPLDYLVALTWQGKYQMAREEANRASNLDPTYYYSSWAKGWIDLEEGRISAAIAELQKAIALSAPPYVGAWLAYAYGASGDRTRALAQIEEMKKYAPMFHHSTWHLCISV